MRGLGAQPPKTLHLRAAPPGLWYNARAMPEALVYLLLFIALVLPVPGVLVLRLLGRRMGERPVVLGAATIFALAILSALVLARSEVGLLRVGSFSLLLPGTRAFDSAALPPVVASLVPAPADVPVVPIRTPRPSATPTAPATATAALSPTPAATSTPEATATATAEPPSATPEPTTAGRRYVVEAGDTFRAIAERFGVTVPDLLRANNLTPEQADNLRVGQELVIP